MSEPTSPSGMTSEPSLVLGGPLYQLYLRCRLARPPLGLVQRRIVAVALITWLPLLILSAIEGRAVSGIDVPFLAHISAHVRFLVTLPLLIGAELLVHNRIAVTLGQFASRRLVAPEDQARFDRALATTARLRNSMLIEVLLLIVAFTGGYWFWKYYALHATTWFANGAGAAPFTLAGYWYVFVSLPLFRFLVLRWYFRILIWYWLLWQISRIPLRLNALHPDRAGGLGFLGSTAFALLPVFLAQSSLVAGKIGDRIWHEAATLPQFKVEIAAIILMMMVFVYFPLTFFILMLSRARRAGRREYGILAARYVTEFREKWTAGSTRPTEKEPLLGSSDIQSLADLANSFSVAREMRLVPFSKKSVVHFGLLLALPFVPLLFTMIPLEEMIDRIIKLAL